MTYTYNNITYIFNQFDSLESLFNKIGILPMTIWGDILKLKYNYISEDMLYTILKYSIEYYYNSSHVKTFYINNIPYWLNKQERSSLLNILQIELENFELCVYDTIYKIDSDVALNLINQIENYSYKCYIVSKKHLNRIKKLKSIEDFLNYDYTENYPEKLKFNV